MEKKGTVFPTSYFDPHKRNGTFVFCRIVCHSSPRFMLRAAVCSFTRRIPCGWNDVSASAHALSVVLEQPETETDKLVVVRTAGH